MFRPQSCAFDARGELPLRSEGIDVDPSVRPGAVGQGKKQRKPLGEVAHHERFGQSFE